MKCDIILYQSQDNYHLKYLQLVKLSLVDTNETSGRLIGSKGYTWLFTISVSDSIYALHEYRHRRLMGAKKRPFHQIGLLPVM